MDSSDFLRAIDKRAVRMAKQKGLPAPKPFKIVEPEIERTLRSRYLDDEPRNTVREYHHFVSSGPRAKRVDQIPATLLATRLTDRQEQLPACPHCHRSIFKMTCPAGWPISTVAILCAHCTRTKGYYDEVNDDGFIFVRGREQPRESPMRQSVTRGGIAHSPRADDELRDLVLMGLNIKVPTYQIAEDLGVTDKYIHSVAVNAGITVQFTHIDEANEETRVQTYIKQDRIPLEANLVQRIKECVAQDMKMWEISKELKCSHTTIRNIMRRNNMDTPSILFARRAEKIRNQYKLGARICDLAKEHSVRSTFINKLLGDMPRHQTKDTLQE